jgi:hypothetical protein
MARTVVPRARERGTHTASDSLPVKLVKYVPAEVLAFFVPLSAILGDGRRGLLWLTAVAAVVGTPLYLAAGARRLPSDDRPSAYFYALATMAAIAWLLGTSSATAHLVGLDSVAAAVIMGLAVFIIPVIDDLLEHR